MPLSLAEALRRHPGAATFRFGDDPAMNARIIALVRSGAKTVTCEALAAFAARGDALPEPGRVDIALDPEGRPLLAIRTEKVEHLRFCDMDEARVPPQGEFRNLAHWREGYEAELRRAGHFAPDAPMVVEWFRLEEDFA